MFDVINIVGQFFTILSNGVYWVAKFCEQKKNILLMDVVSKILLIISYIMLHMYDGIVAQVLAITRDTAGIYLRNFTLKTQSICFGLILLLFTPFYYLTYNGIGTILLFIANAISAAGAIVGNEQQVRGSHLISNMFYTIFLLLNNNYAGVICNLIGFIITVIAMIKAKKDYDQHLIQLHN